MTWVKICGMTNLEDALVAVEAGADAVGFVLYKKSPRYVNVSTVREIVDKLPKSLEKVGVFVGADPESIAAISDECQLTVAQVYSRAPFTLSDDFLKKLPCRVIPAISIGTSGEDKIVGFRVSSDARDRVIAALLDSGNSERPGGTGEKSDWEMLPRLMNRISLKLVVAGGLTPQNVGEAIEILKPWGVDVASGVEASPGKKDPEKVRAFVRAVREIDHKAS
jgi:phosphoribosylanthranilate isomerase